MKLPKHEDKFVITEKTSPCCGNVVSGIHLDVRADESNLNQLWYYVRVDTAYEGDVISCYGGYVFASRTLKGALDYVAHCFAPYQEQEEKLDESQTVKAAESEDMEVVSERVPELPGSMALSGDGVDDHGTGTDCPCNAGGSGGSFDGQLFDCMAQDTVRASENPPVCNSLFDGIGSLGIDPLSLQCMPVLVLPGIGGAAYA